MQGGYYRPQWLHTVRSALDANGLPQRVGAALVGQSFMAGTPIESMMVKDGVDATAVEGVADSPYVKGVPIHRVDLHLVEDRGADAVVAIGRPLAHARS